MQPIALHGHMKPVTQIKFNREGDLLFSCSKEPGISVWYTKTGERLGTYDGHKSVAGLDVNGASTLLATAGFDLTTQLWDVQTGQNLATIEQAAPCRTVGFSHDDRLLFAATDKKMGQEATLFLYNLPASLGEQPVKTAFNPCATFKTSEQIMFAEWGPTNDTIYFGSTDGTVCILDVETLKEIRTAFPHKEEVRRLHFDPNYYTLVTASKDQSACILDSRDLKTIQTYKSDMPINDASVSPVGDHVILGGGTEAVDVTTTGGTGKFEVKFYHKVHEELLASIKCHFGTINSVQFMPNGKGFASGAVDGFVKIFHFDDSYKNAVGAKPLWTPPVENPDETPVDNDE